MQWAGTADAVMKLIAETHGLMSTLLRLIPAKEENDGTRIPRHDGKSSFGTYGCGYDNWDLAFEIKK